MEKTLFPFGHVLSLSIPGVGTRGQPIGIAVFFDHAVCYF
jgi:hypothetical protein